MAAKSASRSLPAVVAQGQLENPQREKFAQAIASGMKPYAAHKAAGYRCKDDQARTKQAWKLRKVPEVRLRIETLLAKSAEETIQSLAWSQSQVMHELKRNIEDARQGHPLLDREGSHTGFFKPDFAAVNRALELYGKQLGMFKETILMGSAEDRALDAMSDEEVRILQEAYDRIEQLRRCAAAKPVSAGGNGSAPGEASQLPALREAETLS